MAQGIADEVPQYLMEVRAIEDDDSSAGDVDFHHSRRDFFLDHEFVDKKRQCLAQVDRFSMRTVSPPQLENVADNAFDALGVVQHDAQQPVVTWGRRLLAQQLSRMFDGRQRVSDFVGDVGGYITRPLAKNFP